jgi:hypothetical protein
MVCRTQCILEEHREEVAVKVEKCSDEISLLLREANIMEHLLGIEGPPVRTSLGVS